MPSQVAAAFIPKPDASLSLIHVSKTRQHLVQQYPIFAFERFSQLRPIGGELKPHVFFRPIYGFGRVRKASFRAFSTVGGVTTRVGAFCEGGPGHWQVCAVMSDTRHYSKKRRRHN